MSQYWNRYLNGNILSLKRQAHNADFRTIDAVQYNTPTPWQPVVSRSQCRSLGRLADKNPTGTEVTSVTYPQNMSGQVKNEISKGKNKNPTSSNFLFRTNDTSTITPFLAVKKMVTSFR
ncbi:hypothetical protein [Fulvivirga imtechensis]|uniref:hypothetical protein n=1 Tax=Fulvivirga imtechensis TaxID=881893 RepID=UPI00058B1BCD|nr:hypothetical protein [Fulvivirga imtechensis]